MIQVILMGHRIGPETREYLKKLDPDVNLVMAPLHVSNFSQAPRETREWLEKLIEGGHAQAGGCRTIFLLSGSSVVAALAVAYWEGLTGELPEILNLIKRGECRYIPSPELPLISLASLKQQMRSSFRMGVKEVQVQKL